MLISTRGRYALRVVIDLAEHRAEGYIPLSVIARRQDISEKYLESIIKLLVRAKLLNGLRGKGGGYQLAKPAAECTAGEILRATENALTPVSCQGLGDARNGKILIKGHRLRVLRWISAEDLKVQQGDYNE